MHRWPLINLKRKPIAVGCTTMHRELTCLQRSAQVAACRWSGKLFWNGVVSCIKAVRTEQKFYHFFSQMRQDSTVHGHWHLDIPLRNLRPGKNHAKIHYSGPAHHDHSATNNNILGSWVTKWGTNNVHECVWERSLANP